MPKKEKAEKPKKKQNRKPKGSKSDRVSIATNLEGPLLVEWNLARDELRCSSNYLLLQLVKQFIAKRRAASAPPKKPLSEANKILNQIAKDARSSQEEE